MNELGNVSLINLDSESLVKKHNCNYHYKSTDFTNTSQRQLKKHAVPISWVKHVISAIKRINTSTYNSIHKT